MASQLQQKLAAFRNNQMKLQTKAVEEQKRKAAAAERAKVARAAKPKAKADAKAKPAAGSRRPAALGKKLKDLLEWLREARAPASAAEILAATGIDVEGDAAMAEAVKANPKIAATSDGLYEYRTLLEIQDAEALLSALRAKGETGLKQSDVDDSYPDAKADIERLKTEGRLYAIHNHDLREFVLYPRDDKLDAQVSPVPALAAVWRETEVPIDPMELERELHKAGIAAAARSTERKRTALPLKEKKRRKQKVRLETATNTHMPELFLGEAPANIDER